MGLAERFAQNRNYQFWILQLVGWSGWAILFALRDAYWEQPWVRTPLLVIDGIVGIVLTMILRTIYRMVWDKSIFIRVTAVLTASYAVALIWQPVKNFSQFYYLDDYGLVIQYGMMGYFEGIIGYSYFLMLCWSGLYFALKFYQMLQDEVQKGIQAEALVHESQLRMLRYQLNPHFLFNTLNAISTLILEKKTETANTMVNKLSNFLRYSLDKDSLQKVDLDHEKGTLKLYLDIEKVRFDERLKVEFNIEPEAAAALIPSLLLQPLVENSIKYAVAQQEAGGKIVINGRREDDDLILEVIDDGPGMSIGENNEPGVMGVGLANVRERLRGYGENHSVVFSQVLPHGLKIEIRIPFETNQ